MKLAIVHDYLTQCGGAERVVLAMADTFPDAPIYTSLYSPHGTFPEFAGRDIRTTFAQGVVPPSLFRLGAPLYGRAFAGLDLSSFDTVLVSSSGFAHHIRHKNAHVYCHTPPRFLYEAESYFANGRSRLALKPLLAALRHSDIRAAAHHENYVANSLVVQERIKRIYSKEVPVIHPPLHADHLPVDMAPPPDEPRAIVVSRLLSYKRIDLAIEVCAQVGMPLTIVGVGPDEARLRGLANSGSTTDTGLTDTGSRNTGSADSRSATGRVTFLGQVSDKSFGDLFKDHSVLLVPGVEDFGMASIEANYSGRPVVAQARGGALETITSGVNGLLVEGEDPYEWTQALKEAVHRQWDPLMLKSAAQMFDMADFKTKISAWVEIKGSEW